MSSNNNKNIFEITYIREMILLNIASPKLEFQLLQVFKIPVYFSKGISNSCKNFMFLKCKEGIQRKQGDVSWNEERKDLYRTPLFYL